MERKMLEQRAVFVEKAKKINLDVEPEDRPRKGGGKVRVLSHNCLNLL